MNNQQETLTDREITTMTLTPNLSTDTTERIELCVSDLDFQRYLATPKDRAATVTVFDIESQANFTIRRGAPCGAGCACAAEVVAK
jgi:hypothetical protein